MLILPFWRRSSSGASKFLDFKISKSFLSIYSSKHKEDQPDDEDVGDRARSGGDNSLPKWDTEFLKVDQGTLFGKLISTLLKICFHNLN